MTTIDTIQSLIAMCVANLIEIPVKEKKGLIIARNRVFSISGTAIQIAHTLPANTEILVKNKG